MTDYHFTSKPNADTVAPAHGRNVDLPDGGRRALTDPAAVRQQLRLLLHLLEDLLPLGLGLRHGLLALLVAAAPCACTHRGGRDKVEFE